MDQDVLKNCYNILGVMQYNPERRHPCTAVLKEILCKNRRYLDIETFVREWSDNRINSKSTEIENDPPEVFSSGERFKFLDQCFVLNTRVDRSEVIEYLKQRYFVYDSLFQREYSISITDFTLIASTILEMLVDRARIMNYPFQTYFFENKFEYGDLGFVKIPPQRYLNKWSQIITFTKKDIQDRLPNERKINIDFFFDNYSFTQTRTQFEPKLRFQERPILKIDETRYALAFPFLLLQCLPQKFEFLLQRIQNYSGLRGKTFEDIALDLFKTIKCKRLRKNFVYSPSEGEIDGILEFENNFWLVECKSRPPSLKSLQGDFNSIQNDINKTVKKSESQIGRALENIEKLNIDMNAVKNPGEIIILEGTYPQLNTTTFFCIAQNKLNIPRLIITYFDLKEILNQPNSNLFEDFLIWRTQKNMPMTCQDEMDYWIWFSKYRNDPERQEFLKRAITNQNRIFYRGW